MRIEIRQLRGSVLRMLHENWGQIPDTVTEAALRRTVQARTTRMMDEALSYLADADVRLIARVVHKRDLRDENPLILFHLTARGSQVIEGTIDDPGVEL